MRRLTCLALIGILFGITPQMTGAGKPGREVSKGFSRPGGFSGGGRSLSQPRTFRSPDARVSTAAPASSSGSSVEPNNFNKRGGQRVLDRHSEQQAIQYRRHLRSEERVLQYRLKSVEQLRALAEQTGIEQLTKIADRMQDRAEQRYGRRMESGQQPPMSDAPLFQPNVAEGSPDSAPPSIVEGSPLDIETDPLEVNIALDPPAEKPQEQSMADRLFAKWPFKLMR